MFMTIMHSWKLKTVCKYATASLLYLRRGGGVVPLYLPKISLFDHILSTDIKKEYDLYKAHTVHFLLISIFYLSMRTSE